MRVRSCTRIRYFRLALLARCRAHQGMRTSGPTALPHSRGPLVETARRIFELKARETDRVKLKKAEAKRRGLTAGLGTSSGRWRNIAAVAGQVARTTRRVLGGQGNVAASVSAASAVSAHVKFRAREPRELVAGQRHQPGGPGSGQRSIRRCPSLAQSLARAPEASARAHILTLRTGTRTQVQISAVSSRLSPASLRAVRGASGRMGRSSAGLAESAAAHMHQCPSLALSHPEWACVFAGVHACVRVCRCVCVCVRARVRVCVLCRVRVARSSCMQS